MPLPCRSFENRSGNIDILYIIFKGIFRRFRFNLIFSKVWFCDFTSDFSEMGQFGPITGNFDENQTHREQTSNKSF